MFLDRLRDRLSDRYDIGEPLGVGGMARVYRAFDHKRGGDVALKVIRESVARDVGTARFLQEIQIAATLQHPHIVPLFDRGEVDGIPYYTMPYIAGGSLKDRLEKNEEFSFEQTARLARQVGAALEYAHGEGFIHRDIKPANILFSSGTAVVADFGIATAFERAGGDRLTDSGVIIGTPQYMSPEQAARDQLDGRSDLYSLGCVLYEMLSGSPPFTGETDREVIVQQITLDAPSIITRRREVPNQLATALDTCLRKDPAERFPSVTAMLETVGEPSTFAVKPPFPWRKVASWAAGLIVVVAATWFFSRPGPPVLDPNRVVVFPLLERGPAPGGDAAAGWGLALMIETALEGAEPLRPLDGWERLTAAARASPELVTADVARSVSMDRGAAHYIAGAVQRFRDTAAVTLSLFDVAADSLLDRVTVSGTAEIGSEHQLAIDALKSLLPSLVDPGRDVDLSHLRNRDAGALALWISGEKAYRQSRFPEALDSYRRAFEEDSALVVAAVKAALAADWHEDIDLSRRFVDAAVAREELLPEPYRGLARGFQAYLIGEADTAIAWLRRARAADPRLAEISTAIGETYYHLLPTEAPLDSLAEAAFDSSLVADGELTTPLFHLVEIAVRNGNADEARRYLTALHDANPEFAPAHQLEVMLPCIEGDATDRTWQDAVRNDPSATLLAAKALAVAGAYLDCAEAGFRAVITEVPSEVGPAGDLRPLRWGALLGLHGVLVAQGRMNEALAMLDSADRAGGAPSVKTLYILDTLAGAPWDDKALETEALGRRVFGDDFAQTRTAYRLWMFGVWYASQGILGRLETVHEALAAKEAQGVPHASLYRMAIEGHLALANRDTATAVETFSGLEQVVHRDTLAWTVESSLPVERLRLAELHLLTGRPADAIRVASVFDHQGPIIFLPYLAASLSVRLRAAAALGDDHLVDLYRTRLLRLGREDLLEYEAATGLARPQP